MTLESYLVEQARTAAGLLSPAGFVAPGTNGASGDPQEPARNTAHWLVSFCLAFRATGEAALQTAAEPSLAYLLDRTNEVSGGVPMRNAAGKDRTNGVLGQAHVVEVSFMPGRCLEATRPAMPRSN